MSKRVSLYQIYASGEHFRIEEEGSDRYEEVWIQPLTVPEKERAARLASAKRAIFLAARHDPEDPYALAVRDEIEKTELGVEYLRMYLVADEMYDRIRDAEAQLSLEEEWRKDGYLDGLRDAWEPPDGSKGLKDLKVEEPENPDAQRVWAELKRFDDQVDERIKPARENIEERMAALSEPAVYDRSVKKMLEEKAELAWAEEFRRCQVWLGTRVCEAGAERCTAKRHPDRYFESREDVDELADQRRPLGERSTKGAFIELRAAHVRLNVDVVEGKDSPAPPSSSASSDPPTAAETADPSGLVDATA